jgi:glycosyltransferase involved in cell wall biosynthesis
MGIEKILHHFSKHIPVNAEAIKDILTNRLRVPEQKIKVIYNGVDTDRFCKYDRQKAKRIRASFGYCQEDFVVTLPGRMEFTKNHICLLRALCALGNENKIKVLFVGNENDAALKSELMRFVDANGLTRKVRFAGRQDDMVSVYNLSDAVVLPSLREGFPNVLLEAMSVGIPVIASDIADNRKIVIDGENGYLFRSDNHAELADILQKMIGESSERLFDMGEVGREMARNKYNVIKMAKAYQDLYKECI